MVESLNVKDFSLKHTLECGQFFMYEQINNWYYIIHGQEVFKIRQLENTIEYDGINEESLLSFFSLNEDLSVLTKDFKNDKNLTEALNIYWGMRLLKQDLWQCIIGFVCSSASNIPKIKLNLYNLCFYFGEKIEYDGIVFYSFPIPGSIDDIEKIKLSKTGYRAEFIHKINTLIAENSHLLEEIKLLNYDEAKEKLMAFPGIGPKVADCICLFALSHKDAFPIDTWVKQAIEQIYLKRKSKNIKEVETCIKENFSGHRGLKQQYLFHYIRNKEV